MNTAPANIIALAEALARAQVARDIAALRATRQGHHKEEQDAHRHLRTVQQR